MRYSLFDGKMLRVWLTFVMIAISCHATRLVPYDIENRLSSSENEDYSAELAYDKLQDIAKKSLRATMQEDALNTNRFFFGNAFMFKNRTVQCRAVAHEIDLHRKLALTDTDQLHESVPRRFREWKCQEVREHDVDEYVEYPCTYFPQDMGDKRLCYVSTARQPCRSIKKSVYFWIRRHGEHWQPLPLDVFAGCHCNYEFVHI